MTSSNIYSKPRVSRMPKGQKDNCTEHAGDRKQQTANQVAHGHVGNPITEHATECSLIFSSLFGEQVPIDQHNLIKFAKHHFYDDQKSAKNHMQIESWSLP